MHRRISGRLLLILALGAVAVTTTQAWIPAPVRCVLTCWVALKAKMAECEQKFPSPTNPIRGACESGAQLEHSTCLNSCSSVQRWLSQNIAFVGSNDGGPRGYVYRIRNDNGPQTAIITTLKSGDTPGGLTHLRLTVNGVVVYENTNYALTRASETGVTLAQGDTTVMIESDSEAAGRVSLWVSAEPLADPSDL